MKKDKLQYKGYIGSVHFSAEDNVFYGKVEGIDDLITFEGESVTQLKESFHEMIDEHIRDCQEAGKPPEKSYKGSFNVRLSPELHRKAAITAKTRGYSLNHLVQEAIKKETSK